MSFGFSVGDFLSAIELVHDLIVAIDDSKGSSTRFVALVQELHSLERALLEVKNINLPASLAAQLCAVQQVASKCQEAITNFLRKNDVFFQSLREGGSKNWWKDAFLKIKWARCRKDDVEELRASLRGHTTSIVMLLGVIQMETSRHLREQSGQQSSELVGRVDAQDLLLRAQMDMLQALTKATTQASSEQQQRDAQLHALMMKSMSTNLQIYQTVMLLRNEMPPQVMRQQPVYLEDARGVLAPFYLEFVTCLDILIYALKDRFNESGARKVDQGKFAIADAGTDHDINLSQQWNKCFRPGQRVNMSLFFNEFDGNSSSCPGCKTQQVGNTESNVTCVNCGILYRRIEQVEQTSRSSIPHIRRTLARIQNDRTRNSTRWNETRLEDHVQIGHLCPEDDLENSEDEYENVDISAYKRVRMFKRERGTKQTSSEDSSYLCFACPFWKYNPFRWKNCLLYRTKEIRELKQHLLRVHGRQISCGRCGQSFEDRMDLEVHHLEAPACKRRSFSTIWLSQNQRERLCRIPDPKDSDVEQWCALWAIIFPDQELPSSPHLLDWGASEELTSLGRILIELHNWQYPYLRDQADGRASSQVYPSTG